MAHSAQEVANMPITVVTECGAASADEARGIARALIIEHKAAGVAALSEDTYRGGTFMVGGVSPHTDAAAVVRSLLQGGSDIGERTYRVIVGIVELETATYDGPVEISKVVLLVYSEPGCVGHA